MDNIIDIELTGRSTRRDQKLWQYDYGQVLRIAGKEFPKVAEVQFSLQQSGGHTLDRIGTSNNGLLTVQIPNELLQNKGTTSDYTIYAFVYLSGDGYGNTKYMIQLPVESRPEPTDPSEDPTIDPSIFKDAINSVNASAERAEAAEKSAKESADKAKEYAESAGKSKEDVEKARDSAISAIGIEKESAMRGIESKTVESLQKIQSQTEASQNSIKQSIADATKKKTELDGAISNATDAKGNLDKAVQSAGNAKTELDTSVGKAGEAKTALDSSINSAGEKQLALDTTVEQANTVDASLKEQIGSAEQIQANVEQIAKNKADISSLNEDLEEVKDKKITKFYASNQGETHLADSDNGKIQDMIIYGRSSQFTTTGKNLLKYPYIETTKPSLGITFTDNKDGSIHVTGTGTGAAYYNLYSNSDGKRLTLASGTYKLVAKGRNKCNVFINNGVNSAKNEGTFTITDGHNDVWCFIEAPKGLAIDETIYPMIQLASSTDESYEPYTGGKPSPNPDYPQEIKSVGDSGSVAVKVTGKNILDMRKSRESITNSGVTYARNADYSFTRTGTATDSIGNVWMAGGYMVKPNADLSNVFCVLLKGVTYSIKDCVLIACSPDGKALVARNENFVPTQDMYITGVRNENFIINKTYNDIVYPAVYVGAKALQYEPYREQLLTLPYTLNAIPVSSDGNVTIDGQQYIADRVVEKDGVFGIERNIREIHTNTKTMNNREEYPGWKNVEGISDVTYYNVDPVGDSRKLSFISNFTRATFLQNNKGINNILYYIKHIIGYSQSELIAEAIDVDMYVRLQDAIFEPLPGDIQAKLRTLVTNYPVTNISVTSDQLDGYTVFNYPISMANGWNYVKQQLGDTRDYIYDMDAKAQDIDLQSAEAYVNSEYAVALTELEV